MHVALNFVQNCVFLTFNGQTGCPSSVKCNSVWIKGKALSHPHAGIIIIGSTVLGGPWPS